MIGLGSMSGYLERLRETKTRRANRQKEFKGGNNYSNVKEKKATYNFPKMSNYTFSEFKKKLKEESQQEQKKRITLWIFTIIIPLTIGLAIFLLY